MAPRRELPDDALVVRGGLNLPEQFETGSGVATDIQGNLQEVSVNCSPGKSVEELSQGLLHGKIGVTTVGDVRAAGGDVTAAPSPWNRNHCVLSGLDAQTASRLFQPTIANPARIKNR